MTPPLSAVSDEQVAHSLASQREQLTTLPENWDGYGAKPLPASIIDTMLSEIESEGALVQLVPGGDGSLQAEWHLSGATVEYNIATDGKRSLSVASRIASLSGAGGVRVKGLEWKQWENNDHGAECETIIGRYVVWELNYHSVWRREGAEQVRVEGPLANAKAAAQSDYATRILSALEPEGATKPLASLDAKLAELEIDTLSDDRLKDIRDNQDNGMATRVMAGELLIARSRLAPSPSPSSHVVVPREALLQWARAYARPDTDFGTMEADLDNELGWFLASSTPAPSAGREGDAIRNVLEHADDDFTEFAKVWARVRKLPAPSAGTRTYEDGVRGAFASVRKQLGQAGGHDIAGETNAQIERNVVGPWLDTAEDAVLGALSPASDKPTPKHSEKLVRGLTTARDSLRSRPPELRGGRASSDKPEADGWIEWKGGKCPVPLDVSVVVRLRSGFESEPSAAGNWHWNASVGPGGAGTIVAYRLAPSSGEGKP